MASKRAQRRRKQSVQCGDKAAYLNTTTAGAAANALRRDRDNQDIRFYKCQWCPAWHIGHTRRGKQMSIINTINKVAP